MHLKALSCIRTYVHYPKRTFTYILCFYEPESIKARDLLKQCLLSDLLGILAKIRHLRCSLSAFDILEVLDTELEEY